MRKFALLICVSLTLACGQNTGKKKNGFDYNRTKKEKRESTQEKTTTPIDLNNTGIGPISDLSFPASIDEVMAAEGATAFKEKCTACHKVNAKLIGPAMTGIYERRHPAWVMNILLNPTEMLKEDPIAKALLKEYNNILMINQNLSKEEARAIAEYLRTL
ncbi:cytochrome c [Flavobacteriaceae bacterium]|nr:cytochrome c [Flavobacteriaceae bacterium]